MVARQGNIRSIYSDNGSNFIGAEQELKKAYMEMDNRKIQNKDKVVTGLDGIRTLLWQVIWVEFRSDRFTQQGSFWVHY